jgi:hypothetical protein
MRTEEYKWKIISGLKNQSYSVSGTTLNPRCIRAGEDIRFQQATGYAEHLVFSFNPTSRKYGVGQGAWIGKNVNENYNNYAYGEDVRLTVRAFARDFGVHKGRDVCDQMLETVEKYLKINAYKLLTGVSIYRYYFAPVKEFYVDMPKKIYGYELSCDVTLTNEWTDEPSSGAKSCYPISGVVFHESGYKSQSIWIQI